MNNPFSSYQVLLKSEIWLNVGHQVATRKSSIFSSSLPLFKSVAMNLDAFSLDSLFITLPSFSEMLTQLKAKGYFLNKVPLERTPEDFLKSYLGTQRDYLVCSPVQLLAQPLDPIVTTEMNYPKEFFELFDKLNAYIAIVNDVLCNRLALKPYEKISDQENVTEQMHALQAGKISYLIHMPFGDVLALLLHDIARPSVNDPEHGHSNHCHEGSTILLPLGLPIDYSGYHAVAKYLLMEFCTPYQDLISPTSKHTLDIQLKPLLGTLKRLEDLPEHELSTFMYQIMFMRLIDDMSKVPPSAVNELCSESADYFEKQTIENMLHQQLCVHLNQRLASTTNLSLELQTMKASLDAALSLLLRAKDYSNNPNLYQTYEPVIHDLGDQTLGLSIQ